MLLDISNQDYHNELDRFGHSALVQVLKSPAHLKHYLDERKRMQEEGESGKKNSAFLMGQALHTAVLEPDEFDARFCVVDDDIFIGALSTMEDYRMAAESLGVRTSEMGKDEIKAAIKAADAEGAVSFKDDVLSFISDLTERKLSGALSSVEDMKLAATSLGLDIAKKKKDEIKAAILAADAQGHFSFKEDILKEIDAMKESMLVGAISSINEYKQVASQLGISFEAPNKDQLKELIKKADISNIYRFKDEVFDSFVAGRDVLKKEEYETLLKIQQNFNAHEGINELLSNGVSEKSYFWTDKATGLKLKIRPDWLILDDHGNILGIVDVKSAREASKDRFARAIDQYGYDIQAAMYSDAISAAVGYEVPFYFAASEKDGPCAVACYKASQSMIITGRRKMKAALMLIQDSIRTGRWDSYQPNGEIEEIDLPRYSNDYAFMDDVELAEESVLA